MKKRPKPKNIKTAVDRIKFAIRFAATDLESLREGDWLNLKDDFCQFLGFDTSGTQHSFGVGLRGEILVAVGFPLPDQYKGADFRKLQGELRSRLSAGPYLLRDVDLRDVKLSLVRDSSDAPHMSIAGSSTRDAFFTTLLFLMFTEKAGNIAKCPECDVVFWRESARQRYCSRRCTNLFNVKAFHVRKKEKTAQTRKGKKR